MRIQWQTILKALLKYLIIFYMCVKIYIIRDIGGVFSQKTPIYRRILCGRKGQNYEGHT